jgi:hypothetical protein
VSPLDGINGARPAFIGPEKRSQVAVAEQMALSPKQRNSIIQPECPVAEVPVHAFQTTVINRVSPEGDLSQRRFDDGYILLDGAAAYTDSGNYPTFAGERHSTAHCTKSSPGNHAERVERLSWLHQRENVCRPHSDKCGCVGLPLGQLDRKHRGSSHTVLKNDISVNVDDADRDRHFVCDRGRLDAIRCILCDSKQIHWFVLP